MKTLGVALVAAVWAAIGGFMLGNYFGPQAFNIGLAYGCGEFGNVGEPDFCAEHRLAWEALKQRRAP